MKKNLFILFSLFFFSPLFNLLPSPLGEELGVRWGEVFATHERAGEITYRCLGGNTFEITVTTYTKGSSILADRCSLPVNIFSTAFADSLVVCRSNGTSGSDPWWANCNSSPCSPPHMGDWSGGLDLLDVKKNIYTFQYTFPGPATYTICLTDPNRNNDIVNLGSGGCGSSCPPLSVQSTILVNPWVYPCNSSPVLLNPPIDRACAGMPFIHNPGAVDSIDGDSLSYKLGVCFEDCGNPIPGYWLPGGVSIDPVTGDFTWSNPSTPRCPGEFNFAIDIEEWRKLADGLYHKIGTIRRDMQVTVECNCVNQPPVIADVQDTCILANSTLTFTVTATDPGNNFIQSFIATGGPFSTTPSATFTSDAPSQIISTGIFSWTPSCEQVRINPYLVTLKATDDGAPDNPPVFLSDYETFFIQVIAPAPENLTALPNCTKMDLQWDSTICNPQSNVLLGYKIYRKTVCDTLSPGYCVTGVPSSWGYSLIATVSSSTTSFTDDNGGSGLVHGFIYSYRIVAYYFDGSESYPSNPVCAQLVRDVPIITNVDVKATDTNNGVIEIKWVKPIANDANYDTTQTSNHGPYRFELMRAQGTSSFTLAQTFSSPYFATLNTTSWQDSFLDTRTFPYTYRVDFYDTLNISCPAKSASSVFLSCTPGDNKIKLQWNEQVPWMNSAYEVYRFNISTSSWDWIATTSLQTYTDSMLANGTNYCYKVKSIGSYSDPSLPAPLINWSQELCCVPVDLEPPCPVTLAVDSFCILSENILNWNNPNNSCSDDALYYIIYHSTAEDGAWTVLDTVPDINITTYIHDSLSSIAGCYAVTSVDSFANESALSNKVCVDNCSLYELPNVFTPNGDGDNDFFTPIHPYKYVKDIDINIFDRWGIEVFRTADPEILWDGTCSQTKTRCSDGIYYYVCIVNEIRLQGIVPRVLKGNVHLLKGKKSPGGETGK